MIATALVIAGGGKLWLVAMLWMSFSGMSLVALLRSQDRSGSEIQNLDAEMGSAMTVGKSSEAQSQEAAAMRS